MSGRDSTFDILLERQAIQVEKLMALLRDPRDGAVVSFLGTVRKHNDGKEVLALEYESYAPMALTLLRELAEKAADRWPLDRIVIHHRLGSIPIGEVAVFIGVSSAHRDEAFQACSYLIDSLKESVPIWKKETTGEGSRWVEESTQFRQWGGKDR